jgi:hypothetical protein
MQAGIIVNCGLSQGKIPHTRAKGAS